MKNIIYGIIGLFFLSGLISCEEVLLDKEPIDIISDNVLWNDERLVEAYLDEVLHDMYFQLNECVRAGSPHIGWKVWDTQTITQVSDEARHSHVWRPEHRAWGAGNITETGGNFQQLWAYPEIRRCNDIIGRMETSELDDDAKLRLTTKARWARAQCYFAMVKRYGGIPLITVAQAVDDPEEELFQPRAKEVDVYDFIIDEMDAIAPLMPEEERQGYPSKWAAIALKSRAALYAASISSFGTVQLDGVVGIPASEAQRFWQASYDASREIITEGGFDLYNNYPEDKVKNYRQIFIDEAGNPESIYALSFEGQLQEGFNHGWDNFTAPQGFCAWAGGTVCVYLDMIEAFDNIDGTPGTFDRATYDGGLWTAEEMFANKEPRFHATIITQGSPWQGTTIDLYTHLILPDGSEMSGLSNSYEGVGATGLSHRENGGVTGFSAIKYTNEEYIMPSNWSSEQDYMVFRYAEILLNCAEACVELGLSGEALGYINQIRERAGVALIGAADRDAVRHERQIELAFEGHRWFDLRRWRTAVDKISRPFSALNYKLDYNSVAAGSPKYLVSVIDGVDGGNQKLFPERLYYLPLTPKRISNNPKMLENPGY
jgi:hypothetical protein